MYIKSTRVFHNKALMAKYKIRPLALKTLTKYFPHWSIKTSKDKERSEERKRDLHKPMTVTFAY